MLRPGQEAQGALPYEFSIDGHVPQNHLLRSIDRFVELSGIRQHLAPFTVIPATLPLPGSALEMHERGLTLKG